MDDIIDIWTETQFLKYKNDDHPTVQRRFIISKYWNEKYSTSMYYIQISHTRIVPDIIYVFYFSQKFYVFSQNEQNIANIWRRRLKRRARQRVLFTLIISCFCCCFFFAIVIIVGIHYYFYTLCRAAAAGFCGFVFLIVVIVVVIWLVVDDVRMSFNRIGGCKYSSSTRECYKHDCSII